MSDVPNTPSVRLSDLFVSDEDMLRELVGREGNESYRLPLDRILERFARCRAALLQIENMPIRIQLGNKLAENPAITHDLAARALGRFD